MQKVTSILPSWDTTKTQSKRGFDKVWGWADKLGAPVNRLSNRIGSEAFWPTTLDKESDKAARILQSFCRDGFYSEDAAEGGIAAAAAAERGEAPRKASSATSTSEGPRGKQKVMVKIPESVMAKAVGLAIFTTMRTGLWVSGAGGSGVLVARKEDGSWSPPSGIMLHTAGLGFLVGVDIYDCVLVINNRRALEAFTKIRATVGGEVSAVAGPVGVGGVLENDGKWMQANRPVFAYLKSRGFYAGVQIDGTLVIERSDENERFYGEQVSVRDILAGRVRHVPRSELKMLTEALKAAEGRRDVDGDVLDELEGQPAPGDVDVDAPGAGADEGHVFGIPELDDPDPYGVHALEKEGLEIREAGTGSRPSINAFEYSPSPSSPIFDRFYRRSLAESRSRSNSNRLSSDLSRPRWSIDAGTQTDDPAMATPVNTPLPPSLMTSLQE